MEKIYQLPPDNRDKIKEFFGGVGCNTPVNPAGAYTKTLELLEKQRLISDKERFEAKSSLDGAISESVIVEKYFIENSRLVFKCWLEGGKQNCLQQPEYIEKISNRLSPARIR